MVNSQRTLVLVKPEGVEWGLVEEIIGRFERRGLKIVARKELMVSQEMAEAHYAEHKDRPFYGELICHITSAPVVAMVLEGQDSVALVRNIIGATNPADAAPGTIRGDYAKTISHNVVHGSDKIESAEREIGIFFKDEIL
jgi:nucleoside-diphosphate kinase